MNVVMYVILIKIFVNVEKYVLANGFNYQKSYIIHLNSTSIMSR
jgi:hypothetical protein